MKESLKKQALYFCVLFLSLGFYQCKESKNNDQKDHNKEQISFDISTAKAIVYTTAHNSKLKLSLTDTILFSDFKQPLEIFQQEVILI